MTSGASSKLAACKWPGDKAGYNHELLVAIRVCSGIRKVRVRPETSFWNYSTD